MQTQHDDKHSKQQNPRQIKYCSKFTSDFAKNAMILLGIEPDDVAFTSCCLPHTELIEQIFNTPDITMPIDNPLIEAGDILYIPYGWHHHIEYLENSLGISHFDIPNINWHEEFENFLQSPQN